MKKINGHSAIKHLRKDQNKIQVNKSYCLITGGASGIGLEFAKIFLKENYNIVLVDISEEKLKEAKELLGNERLNRIIFLKYDLSQRGVAREIFKQLNQKNAQVDVLINNAGFGIFGEFHESDLRKQSELIELSILTTTQLTHFFLKEMVKRDCGKILNISSIAAFQPGPLMAVYYASKAYLMSFSRAIANELKDTNVTVTVLCPGMTRTGFQSANGNPNPKYGVLSTTSQKVASYGYYALTKGKAIAIPRFYNRIIASIHRFLSFEAATRLSRYLQEKNRAKIAHQNNEIHEEEEQVMTVGIEQQ